MTTQSAYEDFYKLKCFELLGKLKELCWWLRCTQCYVFTISFSGNHYRLGKHRQLTSKHCENVVKTKISISIFLSSFFYNHIKLTVMRTFPQGPIYIFLLCYYFEMKRIVLYDFDSAFYHFCGYSYGHDVNVDAIFFFFLLYIRSINTSRSVHFRKLY